MDTSDTSSQYLLLFRGDHWDEGITNEELQKRMDRVLAWFNSLEGTGRVKGGQPLDSEICLVSKQNGRSVSDRSLIESKEAIGGYLLLSADSFDEAVSVAQSCPTLDFGITIEVRPVLSECPVFKRAMERLA